MTIPTLIETSTTYHRQFTDYLAGLSEAAFLFSADDKWTPGQQLVHILLSVKAASKGFAMPGLVLQTTFGTAKAPGRSYDELVATYQAQLQAGGKAPQTYIPEPVAFEARNNLINKLDTALSTLHDQVDKRKESSLDQLRLPHPLIGKLSLREMLYFTIYHVQHHHKNVQALVAQMPAD